MNKKEPLSDRIIFWIADLQPIFVFLSAAITTVVLILAILIPFVAIDYAYGVNGFGPVQEQVITIERLYVDG